MESLKKPKHRVEGCDRTTVIDNYSHKNPTRLLLACLSFTQDETTKTIQKQASLEDWENAVKLAAFHGVAPVLYNQVRANELEQDLPEQIQLALRNFYLSCMRDSMLLSRQVEEILLSLRNEQIHVIPLKGLFLAEKVYRNIALRPMSDIDLLVPYDQVVPAYQVLQSLGYHLTYPVNFEKDIPFLHTLPPLVNSHSHSVDLHWDLTPPEVPFQINMNSIWENTYPDTIAGISTLSMPCEELLLHLGMHFIYMHRQFSRLFHVYDLAMVLRIYQDQIDWNRLLHLAKEWGLEKTTFLSLITTANLLKAPFPEELVNQLRPADYEPHYLADVVAQLSGSSDFSAYLAEFWAPNSLVEKIRIFTQRVFCPPHILRQSYPRLANGIGLPVAYTMRFFDVIQRQLPTMFKLMRHDPETQAAAEHFQKIEQLRRWLVSS